MSKLLSLFPWLDVIIRLLYWKIKSVYFFVNYFKSNKKIAKSNKVKCNANLLKSDNLFKALEKLDVKLGDTIIVHSAFGELKKYGVTPDEVIDYLMKLVGDDGNLVMPVIPILRDQPAPIDRFNLKNYDKIPVYNTSKSKIWTGALPQCLLKREGAVRSRSPLNSMVALGKNAKEIINNEAFNSSSLACGENSALANCLNYDTKILFLGVDEVHSLTMIHVAEDLYAETWPIKNWYWEREFRVIDGDFDEVIKLRERNPFWALFYAERSFSADLLKRNIVKRACLVETNISICSASRLIDFLRTKNGSGYPYKIPFWFKR